MLAFVTLSVKPFGSLVLFLMLVTMIVVNVRCDFLRILRMEMYFSVFRPKASESKAEDIPPPKSNFSVADSSTMRFVSIVPSCVML